MTNCALTPRAPVESPPSNDHLVRRPRGDLAEDLAVFGERDQFGLREETRFPPRGLCRALQRPDARVRVVVRDSGCGAEELRLEGREDQRVGTGAQRQDGDDDGDAGLVSREVPERKAQIALQRVDPARAAGVACLFLEHLEISELAFGGEPRVGQGHSAGDEPFSGAVEVLAHLRLHGVLEGGARDDGAQPQYLHVARGSCQY